MSPRPSARTFADRTGKDDRTMRGMVRRMAVATTAALSWVVEGFADRDGNLEADTVPAFQGVGIVARPPADNAIDALSVMVNGSADKPVIVATRDAETISAVVAVLGLETDETIVMTSQAVVKITAGGEVLIGSVGGSFQTLAKSDHVHGHTLVDSMLGTVTGTINASTSNTTNTKAD